MAVGTNVGLSLLGTLVFSSAGWQEALTIGILWRSRNVTLAWAVAGCSLPWDAKAYLAVCVIPVRELPLLLKPTLSIPLRGVSSAPTPASMQN